MSARTGKIARLSHAVREELNQRLLDNQSGPEILAWLNESQKLTGEAAITPQNLSMWREGGFSEWMAKKDRVDNIKRLSDYALRLAEASGGSLSEGAAAVAGGKILEALEAMSDEDEGYQDSSEKAEQGNGLIGLALALAKLRDSDAKMITAKVNKAKLGQKDEELALNRMRFQRTTCELFIKWSENKRAMEIAASNLSNAEKIEQLGLAMFGEDWNA